MPIVNDAFCPALWKYYVCRSGAEGRKFGRVSGADSAEADRDAADLPSKFRDPAGQPSSGLLGGLCCFVVIIAVPRIPQMGAARKERHAFAW